MANAPELCQFCDQPATGREPPLFHSEVKLCRVELHDVGRELSWVGWYHRECLPRDLWRFMSQTAKLTRGPSHG